MLPPHNCPIMASYIAQARHAVTLFAPTILPLVTGPLNHSLNHLSTQPVRNVCATWLTLSQEPSLSSHVPIFPWVERSNYSY